MDSRWREESIDLLKELSAITSLTHRRLLRLLVESRGELDLSQTDWTPSERRKLLKWSEAFDWLDRGPDNAPTLSVAPEFFGILAEALTDVPRRLPKSRRSQAHNYDKDALDVLLSDMAKRGSVRLLAEFTKSEQALLLSAHDQGDCEFFAVEEWRACPLEETKLGPLVRLKTKFISRRAVPKVASWLEPNYNLLLGTLSTLGLAKRGELKFRIDLSLKKSIERQIFSPEEHPDRAFPIPELPPMKLILAGLERGKFIKREGRKAVFLKEDSLTCTDDLLSLLHHFAGVLDLPSSHQGIAPICDHAFRFLFQQNAPLFLTDPLEVGLNEWIEDTERFSSAVEGWPHWTLLDLKAACWPRIVPLANALGLIEIGLDHLGAPLALRATKMARATFQESVGNLARLDGRQIELETDLFKLAEAALIAPLTMEKQRIRWHLGKKPAAIESIRDFLMAFDQDSATEAWLKSLKSKQTMVKARARSWYVLEVESAELADRVAASEILQNIILERITPTVFLLENASCLTDSYKRELKRLGLDLEAH